jgi:hypothetical protein
MLYVLCFIQTDQGDKTEGLKREGLEMEGLYTIGRLEREGLKRLYVVLSLI